MDYDKIFDKDYAKLNAAQKSAVDRTDGPVMVIAGPGTGKTQLLAMRVANILRATDTDAGGVLCLTFTDNAARNMTERLAGIIGADAYKVAIHTFHSFGAEIISRHGEHFFNGAIFRPADEITTSEILSEILANLPHSNPLAKTMNGQWTYLSDVAKTISDFKKAGLTPDEARQILQQNLKFCAAILPNFRDVFVTSISAKTLISAKNLLLTGEKLAVEQEKFSFTTEPNLAEIFSKSLSRALAECADLGDKTAPLTKWKNAWTTKNDAGELILTDEKRSEKLLAVAAVYEKYLAEMTARGFYDFDDMILDVCRAIEKNPDLKFDLQEKFQYVLVDEFQDTNDVQMRLLRDLTDYDDAPNVMVVGDDDQAIYRFQGADISNIQSFAQSFPRLATITLTENYRSGEKILRVAENVSGQISDRLIREKTLHENVATPAKISRVVADSAEQEYAFVAEKIAQEISRKTAPDEIAVIARNHKQLENLLPFLAQKNIAVDYERARAVLDSEPVLQLLHLAMAVEAISRGAVATVDEYLPKILAHPAWRIAPLDLWKISLAAHKNRANWLDTLRAYSDDGRATSDWLMEMSRRAPSEPLENMLDELFGTPAQNLANDADEETEFSRNAPIKNTDRSRVGLAAGAAGNDLRDVRENSAQQTSAQFISPLYNYFFAPEKLRENPEIYLNFLSDLTTLRRQLRDYRPDQKLLLGDFLEFIMRSEELGRPIIANARFANRDRVKLLTAHKAKGLEFDTVFVVGAESEVWGAKSRGRAGLLPLPHNLPIRLSGDNDDERLRLLFVALTRARKNLVITSHRRDGDKSLLPVEYLLNLDNEELPPPNVATATAQLATAWNPNILPRGADGDLRELLGDTLANYKLSATHLNNFIDLINGGPEKFLMQNLLHFPEAKSSQAAFGTAVHGALQRAHTHLVATGANKPLEDVLGDFTDLVDDADLAERDREFYLKKGTDALTNFYAKRIASFAPTQRAEYSFAGENIVADGAKLTGKIDLLDVDRKAKIVRLTDYKTGKPATSWRGRDDYEKVKLHKYRQQLLFYKILLENSREFAGWTVEQGTLEFVEPLSNGEISRLTLNYDDLAAEMTEFRELVAAVWRKILALDLPDVSEFSADFAGILEFEKALRDQLN